MGPFVPAKKGLCQFQPGFPLLGRSTVTQLVTWCVHWPVAKTSESSTIKGSKLDSTPPPNLKKYTWRDITAIILLTSPLLWIHKGILTVPRGTVLNLNQVRLTWERKVELQQHGTGRGHIFFKQEVHHSKKLKLSQKAFSWENGLQKEAISRHYKVLYLVQLSLLTLLWYVNFGAQGFIKACACLFIYIFTGLYILASLHIPNTSNNWLIAGGNNPASPKPIVPPFLRLLNCQP